MFDFHVFQVISPDPNLSIDQVGIPVHVAKQLTYAERVTKHNLKQLSEAVLNGPDIHPGANFVELKDGQFLLLKFVIN
jgi:DNA-directed RNA polymerase beta' subunit